MRRPRNGGEALIVLCHAGYLFLGSLATLSPLLMPAVIRSFQLPLGAAGMIFPASALGSLAGAVVAGFWSDQTGRMPFLVGGALLSGIGLLGAFSARQWPVFLVSFLLLGMAQGAFSNSINALMLDLSPGRRGRALNTLHGLYSLGATISPFVIRLALGPAENWRRVLLGAAGIWLAVGLAAAWFPYPAPRGDAGQRRLFNWTLLQDSRFAMLFTVAFLYNGIAWALLGWVKKALQNTRVSPDFAPGLIALFFLGLTAGRFCCAYLSERFGETRTLLLCACGTALVYPLATFGDLPLQVAAGVFLSGLFLSGLYPTALAYATRLYPNLSGTVTGTLTVAMTLGASLPPWWTGAIGESWGLPIALRLNYLLVLPLLAIGFALQRQTAQSPPSQEPTG
jgi:fucose permease